MGQRQGSRKSIEPNPSESKHNLASLFFFSGISDPFPDWIFPLACNCSPLGSPPEPTENSAVLLRVDVENREFLIDVQAASGPLLPSGYSRSCLRLDTPLLSMCRSTGVLVFLLPKRILFGSAIAWKPMKTTLCFYFHLTVTVTFPERKKRRRKM